jgi:hypothetical protein
MLSNNAAAENWNAWLDDLPISAEFHPAIDRLQDFIAGLAVPTPAVSAKHDFAQPDADSFADLIADARLEAAKAMQKFPQPNYVISKVAEEAGEVVKAAIHCAEGRETAESVRGEIKQVIAMLYRLWVEGDQVHGLAPLAPQPKDNSNEPDYSDTLWQDAHEVLNGETT